MKKKLENIIKKNSLINKLYTFIGSILMKIMGLFFKEDRNTILFVSYMGKNFNDSPKVIYDNLIKDPYFKNYQFIWAFNDPENYEIKNNNTRKVKMDSFEYLKIALKSSYWITNVNIERGLHFKKNYTKSINTWHGIPLKKIGNDVQGRNDFDFSDTDLFCYSSDYEYGIYKRAFKLIDKNLYKIGMPRNEIVVKNDSSIIDKINSEFNKENKKIILYAPTWREEAEDLKLMNLVKWKKVLSDKYILLIKAHGLTNRFNFTENSFVVDVSNYEETSELIVAADILITDYSSIMFDFSLLSKPIFLYMTDYDKYLEERGVYFDLRKIGLSIFENDNLLLEYIQNHDDKEEILKAQKFNKKFIGVSDSIAVDSILKLMKEGIS